MAKHTTGYFYGEHKRQLFYQSWKVEDAKGILIVTHGFSENTDHYDRFAQSFNKDKWNVYAWDLRGHGRSYGIRGFVRQFRLFERDLVHFLDFILSQEERLPFVLFGHSLGALIICRSLMNEEEIVHSASGICLTSPALGIRMHLSFLKIFTYYMLSLLCPWIFYNSKMLSPYLTRNPYYQNMMENDVFRHKKISPEIYRTVIQNPRIMTEEQKVQCRFLIQIPGNDVVVDNHFSMKYFENLKSSFPKKLICYPNSMHQILKDYGCERVIQDLKYFIQPILSG